MDAAESTIPFQLEVSAGPSAAPIDRTPYDAILQLWAEFCPHLPQPQIPTAARKKAMQTFWAGVVRESTARGIQPLDWIGALFRFVAASDFLSGRSTAWRANLWWVIRPGNCAKVVDGNYDNHTPAAAR